MLTEKLMIWLEIKKAAPSIMKAGGNAVEILIWSQGKTLEEVRLVLWGEETIETFEQKKHYNASVREKENRKAKSKHRNSYDVVDAVEGKQKNFDFLDLENMDTTKRIRELVEYDEKSLTLHERAVLGLVEDDE